MVHALGEIRRVLIPSGILLDLRPVEAQWPVEVASGKDHFEAGRLIDLPEAVADDQAATQAMQEAQSRAWFNREREEEFAYFYYWDTPSEMKETLDTDWEGEKLDEAVLRAVQSAWAVASADARVRVRVKMLISRWRKR